MGYKTDLLLQRMQSAKEFCSLILEFELVSSVAMIEFIVMTGRYPGDGSIEIPAILIAILLILIALPALTSGVLWKILDIWIRRIVFWKIFGFHHRLPFQKIRKEEYAIVDQKLREIAARYYMFSGVEECDDEYHLFYASRDLAEAYGYKVRPTISDYRSKQSA